MNRAFKGIWISADIWLNPDLSVMEKILLAEIDSLDNDLGCWASNAHFSQFMGVGKCRISQLIASLKDKNLITISYTWAGKSIAKRTIRASYGGANKLNPPPNILNTPPNIVDDPPLQNDKGSNTISNTINNTPDMQMGVDQLFEQVFQKTLKSVN